jgi:hypothetical protein
MQVLMNAKRQAAKEIGNDLNIVNERRHVLN